MRSQFVGLDWKHFSENNEVECGLEAALSFVREAKWSIRSAATSPQSVMSQDLC